MRRFDILDEVVPFADPLVENRKAYRDMFAGIINFYKAINPNARAIEEIPGQVDMIRKMYKRNDRIVWALRWLKLSLLAELSRIIEGASSHPQQEMLAQQIGRAYRRDEAKFKNAGVGEYQIENSIKEIQTSAFATAMAHHLSMTDQIPELEQLQFDWQDTSQIISTMRQIEQEWKDNRYRELDHAEDYYHRAEQIIDFGDGFSWWNLGVSSCSAEGAAMGHCGNTAANDGTVLSLRKEMVYGDERKHVPFLTFILGKDGRLGEMKGRGNDKPAKRYHKYIIALLRHDIVKGIKGGGYLAENNFNLNDLDEDVRDELLAEKPALESFYMRIRRLGYPDKLVQEIPNELRNVGLPEIWAIEGTGKNATVVLAHWDDLEEFVREVHWEPLKTAIGINNDEDWHELDDEEVDEHLKTTTMSEETVFDVLEFLDDRYLQKIADDLGIEGNPYDYQNRRKMALHFRNSKYERIMTEVAIRSKSFKNIKQDPDWVKYLQILMGVYESGMENHMAGLKWDNPPDGEISFEMRVQDFIDFFDDGDPDYDELHSARQSARYHGDWITNEDTYNMDEQWKELSGQSDTQWSRWDNNEKEIVQRIYPKTKAPHYLDEKPVDPRDVADLFSRWIDMNESEEDETDRLIVEIMRRAGI